MGLPGQLLDMPNKTSPVVLACIHIDMDAVACSSLSGPPLAISHCTARVCHCCAGVRSVGGFCCCHVLPAPSGWAPAPKGVPLPHQPTGHDQPSAAG
jgi:hypothetical protein